jgi:putative polyketide hydroxylase
MVINGLAGPALLDTYDAERRPTGVLTMGQAMARFGNRMGAGEGPELLSYGAISMGYRYASPAEEDTTPLPPNELTGQPENESTARANQTGRTEHLHSRPVRLASGPHRRTWRT